MTYKELQFLISCLPAEYFDDDVTVHLTHIDEFLPVRLLLLNGDSDVLDNNHPYLTVEF